MVADGGGTNFGPEMAALAKSFKSRLSLWHDDTDIPFIYTVPAESLAPNLTKPKQIQGASTAVPITAWPQLDGVLEAVVK